ncbi:hypothetical protein Bbelb_023490, partial [Branchiostoma belcheri]
MADPARPRLGEELTPAPVTDHSEVVGKTKQEDSRTYLFVAVAILDHASAVLGIPVILQKLKGPRNDFRVDVNLPTVNQACSLAVHKMRTYRMEQVMAGDVDVLTVDSFEDDEARNKVKSAIDERMHCMIYGRQPARTRARQLKKFPTKDGRMATILSCPTFNEQQGRVLVVVDGEDPPLPVMMRKSDLDLERGQKLNDEEFTKMVELLERVLQGPPGFDEDGDTDGDQSSLDYVEDNVDDRPLRLERGSINTIVATITEERQEEQCPVFPWCRDPSEIASMLPMFFNPSPRTLPGELYLKIMCIAVHILRECPDEHRCTIKKALVQGYASFVSPGSCTSYRKCWTFYCSGCKTSDVLESSTFLFRAIMENFLNTDIRERKTNGFFLQPVSELVAKLENLTEQQAYVLLTVVRFTGFHDQYQETLDI